MSLRAQLQDTRIRVLEIIPPQVFCSCDTSIYELTGLYSLVESELHDGTGHRLYPNFLLLIYWHFHSRRHNGATCQILDAS